MSEALLQKHPLFDPASLYNRLRGGIDLGNKMGGYWDWLCVQPSRAEQPLPANEPRLERELRELGGRLTAASARECSVLDALRLRSWIVSESDLEGQGEGSARIVHAGAELLLVREEDGTRTLGLLLDRPPPDSAPGGRRCRAFLLEPPVLKRLAAGLRLKGEVCQDDILLKVFERGTVANNYETTRLICGVPEFEGEWLADSSEVRFPTFAIFGGQDRVPPRAGPLLVAVVFYQPEEATLANKGT
jgi:hypothetical protein